MKNKYCAVLILGLFSVFSFAQGILQFSYDEAGNQEERNYLCASCTTTTPNPTPVAVPEELRVYPNPTAGPITIDWIGDYQTKVSSVLVNSTNYTYNQYFPIYQTGINKITVDLTSKPAGVYFVTFFLNSGKVWIFTRKIIKI